MGVPEVRRGMGAVRFGLRELPAAPGERRQHATGKPDSALFRMRETSLRRHYDGLRPAAIRADSEPNVSYPKALPHADAEN